MGQCIRYISTPTCQVAAPMKSSSETKIFCVEVKKRLFKSGSNVFRPGEMSSNMNQHLHRRQYMYTDDRDCSALKIRRRPRARQLLLGCFPRLRRQFHPSVARLFSASVLVPIKVNLVQIVGSCIHCIQIHEKGQHLSCAAFAYPCDLRDEARF